VAIDDDNLENIQNLLAPTETLFLMGTGYSLCACLPSPRMRRLFEEWIVG
jgi:hypothetical protein